MGRACPSPDSNLIADANSSQNVVDVWDAASRERPATLSGHMGGRAPPGLQRRGSRLASTGDGTVRVWNPRTGEQLLVLRGHIAAVADIAFSPDGSRLVSAGGEGIARIWALDLDDLTQIAGQKVTGGLTDAECRETCAPPATPRPDPPTAG